MWPKRADALMFLGTSETLAPTRISLPTNRFPLEVGMTGSRTQIAIYRKKLKVVFIAQLAKLLLHCAIGFCVFWIFKRKPKTYFNGFARLQGFIPS